MADEAEPLLEGAEANPEAAAEADAVDEMEFAEAEEVTKYVKYVGTADERGLLASDFRRAGIDVPEDFRDLWWTPANDFKVAGDRLAFLSGLDYARFIGNDINFVVTED